MKKLIGIGLGLFLLGTLHAVAGFDKSFSKEGITFRVIETGEGSIRKLKIIPKGLKEVNRPVTVEIEGVVTAAQIADLDDNGAPEIYVFVSGAGSGAYGKVVAYASNRNKSMSEIYFPEINPNAKMFLGHMGHDEFRIEGNRLIRSFPIYRDDDPNCCPTGGKREITYKLLPGEASWLLKPTGFKDLKKK